MASSVKTEGASWGCLGAPCHLLWKRGRFWWVGSPWAPAQVRETQGVSVTAVNCIVDCSLMRGAEGWDVPGLCCCHGGSWEAFPGSSLNSRSWAPTCALMLSWLPLDYTTIRSCSCRAELALPIGSLLGFTWDFLMCV